MSKRWSYNVVQVDPSWLGSLKPEKLQQELDRQGAMGWELVNVVFHTPMAPALLMFKRET